MGMIDWVKKKFSEATDKLKSSRSVSTQEKSKTTFASDGKVMLSNEEAYKTTITAIGNENSCPSVNDFLKHYSKGDFCTAIGVSMNASLQEIRDAIDMFEVEHADRSSEWGIQLAKIKETLLKATKNNNEEKRKENKPVIRIDPERRRRAESILVEADRLFDLGQADKALKKCDEAINIDPLHPQAFSKRGHINRVIAYSPQFVQKHLPLAIQDYTRALELEPHSSYYMGRGACYAQMGDLTRSIPDYGEAIKLDPSNTFAALGKIESEICLGRYNDAFGTYGAWRRDATSPKDRVIGASLVCIALALEGRPYEEYMSPLYDHTVRLSENHDWCIVEIDRHLEELAKTGFYQDRVVKAKNIQALFKNHFE